MVDDINGRHKSKIWTSPTRSESFSDFITRHTKKCPVDFSLLDEPDGDFDESALLQRLGLLISREERPNRTDTEKAILNGSDPHFASLLSQGGCVPAKESVRAAKKRRREERSQKLDKGWFGMPKQDVNASQHDLDVLALRRGTVDSKSNFFKKNDRRNASKYFQVGEIVSSAAEYFSHPTKKSRKRGIADALLEDSEFMTRLKKQYKEIKKKEAMRKRIPTKKRKKERTVKKR